MPALGGAATGQGSALPALSPASANALQAQLRTHQACGHRLHPCLAAPTRLVPSRWCQGPGAAPGGALGAGSG